MFTDALLLVSDAQAITATGYSTNTIDLGNPTVKRQIGTGEAIGFAITVDVAADATTGDETYEFQVVQSDNANLSSHDVIASRTITAANLALGKKHFIPIPPGTPTKRYIGVRAVLAGTTPSITFTAALQPQSMFSVEPVAYAKGYSN